MGRGSGTLDSILEQHGALVTTSAGRTADERV